jgi:hypothetical protein
VALKPVFRLGGALALARCLRNWHSSLGQTDRSCVGARYPCRRLTPERFEPFASAQVLCTGSSRHHEPYDYPDSNLPHGASFGGRATSRPVTTHLCAGTRKNGSAHRGSRVLEGLGFAAASMPARPLVPLALGETETDRDPLGLRSWGARTGGLGAPPGHREEDDRRQHREGGAPCDESERARRGAYVRRIAGGRSRSCTDASGRRSAGTPADRSRDPCASAGHDDPGRLSPHYFLVSSVKCCRSRSPSWHAYSSW